MLEVKNLITKIDEKTILKSINMKVEKGEVIGLIGQIGSGKSTLFNSEKKRTIQRTAKEN